MKNGSAGADSCWYVHGGGWFFLILLPFFAEWTCYPYTTLLRRWRCYCMHADVSLQLYAIVQLHAEDRRRRRCPLEDEEDVKALRQELRAVRAGRAA